MKAQKYIFLYVVPLREHRCVIHADCEVSFYVNCAAEGLAGTKPEITDDNRLGQYCFLPIHNQ